MKKVEDLTMTFQNPIVTGFNPDPSICRAGDDYYLITSSFEFFPGVPIYHSKDLVHWQLIGYCLTRESQLPLQHAGSSAGVWAPTLRYHDGRFYMITTNVSDGGHFYVYTDDIRAEWSDPIWIPGKGHDPDLFFDRDGKAYFSKHNGHEGIALWEIEIETGKLVGEGKTIWKGYEDDQCEAPHLYAIDCYYYLLTAEGGTWRGHMATVARSRSLFGPYESCPSNPILTHRCKIGHPIQTVGHADFVQAHDGSWWAVFLATRTVGYLFHHLGRETFLAPVTWTEDGWPVVNGGQSIEIDMQADTLPTHRWPSPLPRDDFDRPEFGLQWNFLRGNSDERVSLNLRPGWLTLVGQPEELDSPAFRSFVGRRQQHFKCSAAALLEFPAARDGDEAGLTVYANDRHRYEVAVTRTDGVKRIVVRKTIGDVALLTASEEIPEGEAVVLRIDADEHQYRFGYLLGDGSVRTLATALPRYLSNEVTGSFTGIYFAMYATGNGKSLSEPAQFDWFEYIPCEAER